MSKSLDTAIQKKLEQGVDTASELYHYIDKHDTGLTEYELAKSLGWTTGKTSGALRRLELEGLIYSKRKVSDKVRVKWFPSSVEDIYKMLYKVESE